MSPQSVQDSFSLNDRSMVVGLEPTIEEIERILFSSDNSSDSSESSESRESSDRTSPIVWDYFCELYCGDCGVY